MKLKRFGLVFVGSNYYFSLSFELAVVDVLLMIL
jgi:hypothetical protein